MVGTATERTPQNDNNPHSNLKVWWQALCYLDELIQRKRTFGRLGKLD